MPVYHRVTDLRCLAIAFRYRSVTVFSLRKLLKSQPNLVSQVVLKSKSNLNGVVYHTLLNMFCQFSWLNSHKKYPNAQTNQDFN